MLQILAVGAGGFLGAVLRYTISLLPVTENCTFPVKTFAINLMGCIAIGILAVAVSRQAGIGSSLLLFLKVGLCGGFTTFSTFALETADLIKSGHPGAAALYAALSVLAGVAVILAVEYTNAG